MKAAFAVTLAIALAACTSAPAFNGVDVQTGQTVAPVPAPLRPGQSFSGSYLSPELGELELFQEGEHVEGTYVGHLCACTVFGRLAGDVDGNLARVRFIERLTACGPERELQGDGFFYYRSAPPTGTPPSLFGSRTYHVLTPAPRSLPRAGDAAATSVWVAHGRDAAAPVAADAGNHCP